MSWHPYKVSDINKIVSVEGKAGHFIFRCYDHDFSSSSAMTFLKLHPLCKQTWYRLLETFVLICSLIMPLSNDNYIVYNAAFPTIRGHIPNLKPFFGRTNMLKFSFFPHSYWTLVWSTWYGSWNNWFFRGTYLMLLFYFFHCDIWFCWHTCSDISV